MTCVILFLLNLIPGLSLRVDEHQEDIGLDDDQLGEFAYDYVEVTRSLETVIPGLTAPNSTAGSISGRDPEKQV